MPTGAPFDSLIHPYRIRVDDFAGSSELSVPPLLHLLTHTHSDHTNGLNAASFASNVICSKDAKMMLLRHERYAERALKDRDIRAERVRTFKHLRVPPRKNNDGTTNYNGVRDLLKATPLRVPTQFQLSDNSRVTLTLFDANHCPGAVMYLVEGAEGAVLHTGDFRAEPAFREGIIKEPFLQKYLASSAGSAREQLEAIHLDTACLLNETELPSKAEATSGLVSLMRMYPESTRFFINAWTWGYEDILRAIASGFETQVHLDRYKFGILSRLSDTSWEAMITEDGAETRFHACERFDRCEYVRVQGRAPRTDSGAHVVYVNPVNMRRDVWEDYKRTTEEQIKEDPNGVNHLLVPLARHSSLPELRSFVSLFKPKRVVPNTLDPLVRGLDQRCIPSMFGDCLAPADSSGLQFLDDPSIHPEEVGDVLNDINNGEDFTLANLEGDGALDVVLKWADSGKLRRKLEILARYLPGSEGEMLRRSFAQDIALHSSPLEEFMHPSNVTSDHSTPLVVGDGQAQGRATHSETERAMARIHTSVHFVPAAELLERDKDEDEDTQHDDDAHTYTAEAIFGEDLFEIPRLDLHSSPAISSVGDTSPERSCMRSMLSSPSTPEMKKKALYVPLTPDSSPPRHVALQMGAFTAVASPPRATLVVVSASSSSSPLLTSSCSKRKYADVEEDVAHNPFLSFNRTGTGPDSPSDLYRRSIRRPVIDDCSNRTRRQRSPSSPTHQTRFGSSTARASVAPNRESQECEKDNGRHIRDECALVAREFHRSRPDLVAQDPQWAHRTEKKASLHPKRARHNVQDSGDCDFPNTEDIPPSPTRRNVHRLGSWNSQHSPRSC